MTLLQIASHRQLALQWDAEPRTKPEHLAEWVTGSGVSPGIAATALESIAGLHQVVGFLNPRKLGRSQGYATMPVQRARKHYANPARGGWLASGHAPLEDGRLVPVTFKPNHPRLNAEREPIKYERPAGSRPVPFFTPLDAEAYEAIAARAGLQAPPFTSSWSAWRWLLAQRSVELTLDEGEKKAAAGCSAGWLTIGLAGIWNGCPRPKDATGQPFGAPALIAELQWLREVRPTDAPLTIAFDASEKPLGRVAIRKARRTLGRLLIEHGHQVRIRELVQPADAPQFIKGTDDLLVHGGAAALAALPVLPFADWQKTTSEAALEDHLLQPFKTRGRRQRLISRHFKVTDIPKAAGLVALIGGMGSNKTGAVAELASTHRLVSMTHRRSLADNQGQRFGLPVKREGQVLHAVAEAREVDLPQVADLVAEQDGFVVVVDSSYIGGSSELQPHQCAGAVLFVDEADAFLRHCLTANTHIEKHRTDALTNLAACVAAADQVVLAGAHIDELTLQAFEAMRGCGMAHIVESTLQPAAGRQVVMHRKVEQLLQQLRNLASKREPFIVHTGSKQVGSKMAPANLARLVKRWWPDARIIELTAETIRDPDHQAAAAIENPQLLVEFDVVLASPVLETGFSIEDPAGHFKAVLGHTSGHQLPHAFVQSLGRLRTSVVRHIWCNHSGSRVGNGAPVADEIESGKLEHAERLVRLQLVDAGAACGDAARFLRWWSELAAEQNWLGGHYRHAVATLLGREGYEVERLDTLGHQQTQGSELSDALSAAREQTIRAEADAVAGAEAVTNDKLQQLESLKRLTAGQRCRLERGRIQRDLGIANPTAAQVIASRNDGYRKALQHLLVVDATARERWLTQAKRAMTPSQRQFAPDATAAVAPGARAAVLAQLSWLPELMALAGTGHTITMATYEADHQAAAADRSRWRELLGFDPGAGTTRTFIAHLVAGLGFKLQRTDRRTRIGERLYWHYEVIDELAVLDRERVQTTIRKVLL